MSDALRELRRDHLQLLDKRRYFLLASSGTALGFSITQVGSANANEWFFLFPIALGCFGLSFVAGLNATQTTSWLINANSTLLEMEKDVSQQRGGPQALRKVADEQTFNPLMKRLNWLDASQKWSLFTGAALIALWKILGCNECVSALSSTFDKG